MDTHTPTQAGIGIATPVCYSEIGAKANQEDALFPLAGEATARQRVFLVCDGMGGHEHGEVASQCVAHTVGTLTAAQPPCDTATMRTAFEQALATAYDRLDEIDTPPSEGRTMGTTLTFLALCTDGILIAHIGDSRVYQLRPGEDVVMRTLDHSLVSDLIAAGELTEDEARTFPQRNVITRAIQPHQERRDRATYNVVRDVREGDVFLLCCDGVVEQLDDASLCALLLAPGSLTDRLAALRLPHRHNRRGQPGPAPGGHAHVPGNTASWAAQLGVCSHRPAHSPGLFPAGPGVHGQQGWGNGRQDRPTGH